MSHRLLVAGAGQLGSRYLQGMAKLEQPADLWIYDPSPEALTLAQQRWSEVAGNASVHNLHYVSGLSDIPDGFDVAIVATTADVRPLVVSEIAARSRVKNWILEKVLAQSHAGLLAIQEAIGPEARAWVNTPMYMWPLYQALADIYVERPPIKAEFVGFRGLTCNAIHYIDFVARWNGSEVVSVDLDGLKGPWYASKRCGFYEIDGTIQVEYSDGSTLKLSSERESLGYKVHILIEGDSWQLFESAGYGQNSEGRRIEGGISFQSQMTAPMIEAIFSVTALRLPTLVQSVRQHHAFLEPLLNHWNRTMPDQRLSLPVT